MKKNIFPILLFLFFLFSPPSSAAAPSRFSETLCLDSQFDCIEIQEGQTWDSLWPDESYRQQLKELNRLNLNLRPGMKIAVPRDKDFFTRPQSFPLPTEITPSGEKQIQVDLSKLAWGAYDEQGKLVQWGAASGGKAWCPDIQAACKTVSGEFSIIRKEGASCKSKKFPVGKGGAPMPYCMFFKGGYAVHGSREVPGYNASHGCVRIFPEDAKWLNEEFGKKAPDASSTKVKVVVQPY